MAEEPYVVGSTYRHRLAGVTKDGTLWDLAGATVQFCLKDPAGAVTEHAATVEGDGSTGCAYWDSLTTTFAAAGRWSRSWKVSQAGVVQETPPIGMTVVAAP